MYRFEFMDGDCLIIEPEEYGEFQKWVNLAPFAFPAQRNEWAAVLNGKDHSISALGIFEKDAEFFGIEENERIVRYPSCDCLYTVVKIAGEEVQATEYLKHLMEYVENNRIQAVSYTHLDVYKRQAVHGSHYHTPARLLWW